MSMTPEQIAAVVDASAAALALPLAPEHREGVLRYFALAADMAAIVEAVPLTERDESLLAWSPRSEGEGA